MHPFRQFVYVFNAISFFHRWCESEIEILLLLVKKIFNVCVCEVTIDKTQAKEETEKSNACMRENMEKKIFLALFSLCKATAFSFTYALSCVYMLRLCTLNNVASLSRSEICILQKRREKGWCERNKYKKATIVSFIEVVCQKRNICFWTQC